MEIPGQSLFFVARVYTGGKMDSDSIQRAVPIIQVKQCFGSLRIMKVDT